MRAQPEKIGWFGFTILNSYRSPASQFCYYAPLKYSLWWGLAIIISRMAVSGLRINFIHQHLAWTLPVRLPASLAVYFYKID